MMKGFLFVMGVAMGCWAEQVYNRRDNFLRSESSAPIFVEEGPLQNNLTSSESQSQGKANEKEPRQLYRRSIVRKITFKNRCDRQREIYIAFQDNKDSPAPLLEDKSIRLGRSGSYTYVIPEKGWAGRFWPKTGCDRRGQYCAVGQSVEPCPRGGCQPPAETKVQFNFPKAGDTKNTSYHVDLIDGFSLRAEVIPIRQDGSCIPTNCNVNLEACPSNENDVGDLRVQDRNYRVVMCLSPCKKWNFRAPYGRDKSETVEPGLHYCCPSSVSSTECQTGPVVNTKYVDLVHKSCPKGLSHGHDVEGRNIHCPSDVSYTVTFC